MRSRLVHIAMIMMMLSACAGTDRHGQAVTDPDLTPDFTSETTKHLEHARHNSGWNSPSDKYEVVYHREPARHHHHEPSPEEVYAGQVALLLSAQIFTCAFFVIILDGSCNFYASTGYYY